MNLRNSSITYLLITVALTLLVSCNRKVVYSHYENIPDDGWERTDTLKFSICPIIAEGDYREDVGLRINNTFPFRRLMLIVDQHTVPSGMMRSDTLHARLIDHNGSIEGKGINYFQYEFHLANIYLNTTDTLFVTIRHNMKRELLGGVADVGITITQL